MLMDSQISLVLMTSEVKDILTAPGMVPRVVAAQPGISHDGEGRLSHSSLQWMPRAAELPPTTSSTDIHGTDDMTKKLLSSPLGQGAFLSVLIQDYIPSCASVFPLESLSC